MKGSCSLIVLLFVGYHLHQMSVKNCVFSIYIYEYVHIYGVCIYIYISVYVVCVCVSLKKNSTNILSFKYTVIKQIDGQIFKTGFKS